MEKEFAVYKGDKLLCMGTLHECAQALGVKPETILYYQYPCYERKGTKSVVDVPNRRVTIPLD